MPILIPIIALLGGLIPTSVYVLFVWWLDRFEKEPIWTLLMAFLWGVGPAAFLSVILEVLLEIPIRSLGAEGLAGNLLTAGISAPFVEESIKGWALLALVIIFRSEFDDVLDGIVYGSLIGLGFALTENVMSYFIPILSQEGIGAGLVNIFMRSIVFGANHAFWTGVTGAAIGYARLVPLWSRRLLIAVGGWLLALSLHAIHNAGATLAEQTACLSLGLSLAVDWGGVLLLLGTGALALRRESEWIDRGLREEVKRGHLTSQELDVLISSRRRMAARWQSRVRGGAEGYRAVGRYFQCATELAFKKQQLRSLGDEGGNLAAVARLRQELVESRTRALPWLDTGMS